MLAVPDPKGVIGQMVDTGFLERCAYVCVDFQPNSAAPLGTVPEEWSRQGITLDDANAALDYHRSICLPNARRVADACRAIRLPMVFVHWGYRCRDGMDLAPPVRSLFLKQFGSDYGRWPHYIGSSDSRPADELGVRDGEYVLAKSAQDAFESSNIEFILQNLDVRSIVFVGGHTGACLGKTASSAKRLGYRTLCVEDATDDAAQSRRLPNILATGYDYVLTTDRFVQLASRAHARPTLHPELEAPP